MSIPMRMLILVLNLLNPAIRPEGPWVLSSKVRPKAQVLSPASDTWLKVATPASSSKVGLGLSLVSSTRPKRSYFPQSFSNMPLFPAQIGRLIPATYVAEEEEAKDDSDVEFWGDVAAQRKKETEENFLY
ncbi:hypothetical protein GB937_010562 [Aspergillus fischeri]|nr:hypothetical protein GB937_010562 [Aspergillus fischeri]